jgi:hypothetical protein
MKPPGRKFLSRERGDIRGKEEVLVAITYGELEWGEQEHTPSVCEESSCKRNNGKNGKEVRRYLSFFLSFSASNNGALH